MIINLLPKPISEVMKDWVTINGRHVEILGAEDRTPLEARAVKLFGVSDKPGFHGFMTTDGKFIQGDDNNTHFSMAGAAMGVKLTNPYFPMTEDEKTLNKFLEDSKSVRYTIENFGKGKVLDVQVHNYPTYQQLAQIKDIPKQSMNWDIYNKDSIMPLTTGGGPFERFTGDLKQAYPVKGKSVVKLMRSLYNSPNEHKDIAENKLPEPLLQKIPVQDSF